MATTTSRRIAPLVLAAAIACAPGSDYIEDSLAAADSAMDPAASEAPARTETSVRIVNALPGGPSFDLYAGEHAAFTNVGHKDFTAYHTMAGDAAFIRIVRTGSGDTTTLAEFVDFPRDGQYYTVVALPATDGRPARLIVMRDDPPGDPMKARVRLVHAAARAGTLDVLLEGGEEPLFDDVDFEGDVATREVEPGTVSLVVRPDDEQRVVLRLPDLALEAGKTLTLVLTHPSATGSRVEAVRVTDAAMPATPPGGTG
jgi:hypothetical protein